ncbi:MAG: dihydroneopterin aldolase, partial [Bifidobacteriaceae bacterium]|nr:dihydroneopterin aldolase [Bifidobacteriaceae bacterium]
MERVVNEVGAPLDAIEILGVSARGRHGVFEIERTSGQLFEADVRMYLDTREAAAWDRLDLSVDYAAVGREVANLIAGESVCLIETLAQRIADSLLDRGKINSVDVVVHKPDAGLGVGAKDVSVSIHRSAKAMARPAGPGPVGPSGRPGGPDGVEPGPAVVRHAVGGPAVSGPPASHPAALAVEALRSQGMRLTRRAIADAAAALGPGTSARAAHPYAFGASLGRSSEAGSADGARTPVPDAGSPVSDRGLPVPDRAQPVFDRAL